jgi:hypothetical protein
VNLLKTKKINVQIKAIDTQISALTGTVNDINSSVASLNDSIYKKQISMMLMLKVKKRTKQKQNVLCLICNPSRYRIIFNILLHRKEKKQQLKILNNHGKQKNF